MVTFHPFTRSLRGQICTKYGTKKYKMLRSTGTQQAKINQQRVANVITRDKLFGDRLRGVDFLGFENSISHRQAQSPLTQGWCYCTASDDFNK